ncbi:fasciclin domain-containing protein [Mucilaginibacter sp. AW1-3]
MKKIIILLAVVMIAFNANAQTDSSKKTAAKQPTPKTRMVGDGMMSSVNDLVKNLSKSKDHTIFAAMLSASGLAETLKSGTYTVFAPTDNAFKKLPAGTIDSLMKPAHSADLTQQVNSYLVKGKLSAKDIAKQIKANGQTSITTVAGTTLMAKINPDRNIVLTDANGNQATVSQFDIEQSNGLLDVITAPLSFKTN